MPERRPPKAFGNGPDPAVDPPGGGVPGDRSSPEAGGSSTPADRADSDLREALREVEGRYRHLVENSEDLIFTHDLDGKILSANPTLLRETGREASALIGHHLRELVTEDAQRDLPGYFETLVRDGQAHGFLRIRTPEGERILQYDNSVGVEEGRPIVRAIAHDVQRRFAEHALPVSVRRLEALLNNIPDLAWMKDEASRFTAVNEAFARFVGKSRREIVGRTDFDLFSRDVARKFRDEDLRAMETGEVLRVADQLPSRDGETLLFDTIKTPIRDERGNSTGTAGIARDVTERRRLEERLIQSQKMEAIGRLAGGVAHDFNNLLTTILGFSGLVLDQLRVDDALRSEVEEIQKAGERAATLTQQLLAFSRKQVIEPSLLDLNAVVSEATKMLRRLIGEDVELETRLQEGLGGIRADRGQVEQVLVNLAVNARDAMPQGGKLVIETRSVPAYVPYRAEGAAVAGAPFVLLSVSDSGAGMDAETRRHIFEPFFTTKERGKGTGLGLATVYGIVKQSGGDVWVESEIGCGSKFSVYLPRADGKVAQDAKPSSGTTSQGSETLLLVEDEEAVRRLTTRVLTAIGYEVLSAADAAEARTLWRAHGDRIRLLVTDVIMPGGSGPQLARDLREQNQRLRVLYISGYTDSALQERDALQPGMAYLQKPFTPETLSQKIRRVLDGPDGSEEPAGSSPPD